jgi:7-cyano-7-deazaguanine tRNA-ribosyltransferase
VTRRLMTPLACLNNDCSGPAYAFDPAALELPTRALRESPGDAARHEEMVDSRTSQPCLDAVTPDRQTFRTRTGATYRLPLFLPVYQPRNPVFQLAAWEGNPVIEGIIVNAYFLYKQRGLRSSLASNASLKDFVGFHGLVTTDSGAFQGLTRQLYLTNKDIVRFQDAIGSDVIAPLDLITPPGDKRTVAVEKLRATERRVAESLRLVQRGIAAGVQQGGRFLDLRHEAVCRLMEMGIEYLAIGSLVPFFNVNHDIAFPGAVLIDARREAGPDIPIHVYGAGDPCELPFMVACGATIFDSASYGHYAMGGWYMTPYGSLSEPSPVLAGEFTCPCPACRLIPIRQILGDKALLMRHNLWTICDTVDRLKRLVRSPPDLEAYLEHILLIHQSWFPSSRLKSSWQTFQDRLSSGSAAGR